MLNIFICDDNSKCLSMIERCIKDYTFIQGLPFTMACATTSPDDMLSALKHYKEGAESLGAYFLDIHLKNPINGINLAETVRKYDPRGFIIFITMDPDFLPITLIHKLEILDYIVKSEYNMEEKICKCIDSIYDRLINIESPQLDRFIFTLTEELKGTTVSVNFSDILCLQSFPDKPHSIILYTHSHRYMFRGSLSKIIDRLDDRFFRCHRGAIINLEKITALDRKLLIAQISNEHEVYVAHRAFGKLKRSLELL